MDIMQMDDRQLITNYLTGDQRSFEVLFNRHRDRIYTSIYLFVRDEEKANDLFQDVFIKIINTLRKGKYNHEGKFIQWALRISYNLCVDNFRKSKKQTKVAATETFDILDVLEAKDLNREDTIIKSEIHTRIRELVDKLPKEQREVVILRHYADMSFKEISQLTRVSINTAAWKNALCFDKY